MMGIVVEIVNKICFCEIKLPLANYRYGSYKNENWFSCFQSDGSITYWYFITSVCEYTSYIAH